MVVVQNGGACRSFRWAICLVLSCRPVYECLSCTIVVLVDSFWGRDISPGAMPGCVTSQIVGGRYVPGGESSRFVVYPGSFRLLPVGEPCGMLSIKLVACSLHSRWETIGFGVVYGNIPCVGLPIKLPPLPLWGPELETWTDGPFRLKVSRVCLKDYCESGACPYPYVCLSLHSVLRRCRVSGCLQ